MHDLVDETSQTLQQAQIELIDLDNIVTGDALNEHPLPSGIAASIASLPSHGQRCPVNCEKCNRRRCIEEDARELNDETPHRCEVSLRRDSTRDPAAS